MYCGVRGRARRKTPLPPVAARPCGWPQRGRAALPWLIDSVRVRVAEQRVQVRAQSECEQCYHASKRLLRSSVEGFVAVFDVRASV